jgi:hypothetical protein
MMKRIVFLAVLMCLPLAAFSAGDYIWEEKFKKLMPAAEAGDLDAQYDVGEMYQRGRGVVKNMSEAFNWYLKSAKQGNTKGSYRVGVAYLKGKGVQKDPQKAFEWLSKSADAGYERAFFYLGEMYEKGTGVTQDYDKALSWYQKSQHGGFAPAVDRVARVKDQIAEQKLRAKRLAEAAARQRIAKRKQRARKVSRKPSLSTKDILMKGGWKKKNRPVEFMPSNVVNCDDKGKTIECLSGILKRNIGMADVSYHTKAILFSIDDNGSFKVSYRNNVTDVRVTDPEFAASGREVPVKKGWQDAEHILECEIENSKEINCTKDKVREVTFTR